MSLKVVWVGRKRSSALKAKKKYERKHGDALMSSGKVRIRGKTVYGYAIMVSARKRRLVRKKKTRKRKR